MIGLLGEAVWLLIRGVGFLFKILLTYFWKCGRDVIEAMRDEWKNREIDDEIY